MVRLVDFLRINLLQLCRYLTLRCSFVVDVLIDSEPERRKRSYRIFSSPLLKAFTEILGWVGGNDPPQRKAFCIPTLGWCSWYISLSSC